MDGTSYRALHAALLATHRDATEQTARDLERQAMTGEDLQGQQQRRMLRGWKREWEFMADLAEPRAADAISQGGSETEIARRIEDVLIDVFDPFLNEILLWEYRAYARDSLREAICEDLRAGRLADLESYLRHFQEEFLDYYSGERYMAGYGPVHRRWTADGPVPKRRR